MSNINHKNTPIADVELLYSLSAFITYPLGKNLYFKIAKISYELFENESYQYIIEPFYDMLDAFQDLNIPGIDIDMRQSKYYRINMIPIFVSDRTFPRSRVEARELLKDRNINYYNPLLWLIDSKYTYTGDKFLVKSEEFFNKLEAVKDSRNIYRHIIYSLQRLGRRHDFSLGTLNVDEKNRRDILQTYLYQYSLVEKTYYKKIAKNAGRPKKAVPSLLMKEIVSLYENKIISLENAMKRLSISSESTFYRRLREYRNNEE